LARRPIVGSTSHRRPRPALPGHVAGSGRIAGRQATEART
jgi:hypothetical protein